MIVSAMNHRFGSLARPEHENIRAKIDHSMFCLCGVYFEDHQAVPKNCTYNFGSWRGKQT